MRKRRSVSEMCSWCPEARRAERGFGVRRLTPYWAMLSAALKMRFEDVYVQGRRALPPRLRKAAARCQKGPAAADVTAPRKMRSMLYCVGVS